MRAGRGGNSSWWQCALSAALLVPALACFSEDGVDLGEGSSPKGSQTVAAVKQVSTQPDVQFPVPASVTRGQVLKRPAEALHKPSWYGLPPAVSLWDDLQISGWSQGEGPSAGGQGVIGAGAARPTPSGTAAVRTDKLRGRSGELRSLEHTYRAALLSLFTDSSSSFQLDQLSQADMTLDEGAFSSEELFGDSNPFEEALASNEAERAAQPQEVAEEVPPAAAELMAPLPRLSLPFPAPKDF